MILHEIVHNVMKIVLPINIKNHQNDLIIWWCAFLKKGWALSFSYLQDKTMCLISYMHFIEKHWSSFQHSNAACSWNPASNTSSGILYFLIRWKLNRKKKCFVELVDLVSACTPPNLTARREMIYKSLSKRAEAKSTSCKL